MLPTRLIPACCSLPPFFDRSQLNQDVGPPLISQLVDCCVICSLQDRFLLEIAFGNRLELVIFFLDFDARDAPAALGAEPNVRERDESFELVQESASGVEYWRWGEENGGGPLF